MDDGIKSGKEIIDEFFDEIMNIDGVDQKTIKELRALHKEGKFTDVNIQNAMEQALQKELNINND
jgi:hypothetical protein